MHERKVLVEPTEDLVTRFKSIESLQSLRARQLPGSYRYEVADRAIDLALQPVRQINNYLIRNSLRDARRILGRQRTYFDHRLVSIDQTKAASRESDGVRAHGHELLPWDSADPERIAAVRSLVRRIEASCCSSITSRRCLQGMLRGETPQETAREIKASASYVKKVRARIRAAAAGLLEVAA